VILEQRIGVYLAWLSHGTFFRLVIICDYDDVQNMEKLKGVLNNMKTSETNKDVKARPRARYREQKAKQR